MFLAVFKYLQHRLAIMFTSNDMHIYYLSIQTLFEKLYSNCLKTMFEKRHLRHDWISSLQHPCVKTLVAQYWTLVI